MLIQLHWSKNDPEYDVGPFYAQRSVISTDKTVFELALNHEFLCIYSFYGLLQIYKCMYDNTYAMEVLFKK